MTKFAAIGNNIDHSLSPIIHREFAKQFKIKLDYQLLVANEFNFKGKIIEFFSSGGKGLSVTSPFKQTVFNLAQHQTANAFLSQAANTLWLTDNQEFKVDNTDGLGLITDLQKNKNITIANKTILILGCGGVVSCILPSLLQLQPQAIVIFNRTESKALKLIQDFNFDSAKVILYKNYFAKAIDLILDCRSFTATNYYAQIQQNCSSKCKFYSLSYGNIAKQQLQQWQKVSNMPYYDGLGMLIEQAALQFQIWHNKLPNTAHILTRLT